MTEESPPSFRELLKRHRISAGLTQEALAERAGLSVRGLSDIERGIRSAPRLDTVRLLADTLQLEDEERSRFTAAARPIESPRDGSTPRFHPLPAQLTPLVGRMREVEAVCGHLQRSEVWLVTLVGPGGIGKTRLGLQVARELQDSFTDGVAAVMLAALRDPALVAPTIAQTLGLQEATDQSHQERLAAYLRPRSMLLVLDNFEQILEAAPFLQDLLEACPDLKLLVTSRAALHLHGEHQFPVPPLPLPQPGSTSSDDVAGSAVELFLQRAQAVDPDFRLTSHTAPTVIAICARLDGLPLAIELAAARIKLLTPEALLRRLGRRLEVTQTAGGGTQAPGGGDRHRTLRATLAWSYDLLDGDEQVVFRRLAVFAGGFSLEAAEQVCGLEHEGARDVLDVLAGLVDKSLLQRADETDGEPRLTMLETVHEYAWELLTESGETEIVRRRHAQFFLQMAEGVVSTIDWALAPALAMVRSLQQYDILEREHDNLRIALVRSLEGEDGGEVALRLAVALAWFWEARGHWREGRGWLERVLALPPMPGDTPVRARGLTELAAITSWQGDYRTTCAAAERSVELLRDLDDTPGLARAIGLLGWVVLEEGDQVRARSLHQEQIALWRQVGNVPAAAWALCHLGWVELRRGDVGAARACFEEGLTLMRRVESERVPIHLLSDAFLVSNLAHVAWQEGNSAEARHHSEEALALARRVGDFDVLTHLLISLARKAGKRGDYELAWSLLEENLRLAREQGREEGHGTVSWAANHLGDIARTKGDIAQAEALYEESGALFRRQGHTHGIAVALHNLGHIALSREEVQLAQRHFEESLRLFHALQYTWSVADCLAGLAGVAVRQGKAERAAQLFGAAEAIHEAIDSSGDSEEAANRAAWDRDIAAGRSQIDDSLWAKAWAAGRAMSVEQAVAAALPAGRVPPEYR